MTSLPIEELHREIQKLRAAAEDVQRLAAGIPAAECNASMILRHVEMLEIEISDAAQVLLDAEAAGPDRVS